MVKSNRHPPSESGRKYARSEATREKILAAALEEAVRVGFHKVSMANIAARAEVAVGILNYHFGTRDKMLGELMSAEVENFWSHMVLPRAGRGFFEYEAAIVGVYLEFLHAKPHYMQMAEEFRRHEPELYQQAIGDQLGSVVNRIEGGIRRGELPSMSADGIRTRAYLINGSYSFLSRLIEDDEYPGDEFVIANIMNMLRHGIIPDPADIVTENAKSNTASTDRGQHHE